MTLLSHTDVPVSVLDACDTALEHAVSSRKKTRELTDVQFDKAIHMLFDYERKFHPM